MYTSYTAAITFQGSGRVPFLDPLKDAHDAVYTNDAKISVSPLILGPTWKVKSPLNSESVFFADQVWTLIFLSR